MKKLFKKVVSVALTAALTLSMAVVGISSASAANYAYGDYTTITNVPTRSNCYAMEALAVGSTYLYTVKVDLSTNKCAVISKINKNTGAITKLSTNSGATTFNYLGHANAMDVATVNGKSNLYISTMTAATNNLVRMEVNGSKINKKGAFTIRKDGQPISMPCMAITANTSTTIEFLFSRGCTFYKGSINKNATSGYIDVSYAFKVNTKEVMINGKSTDLSAFCWQDFGYHNGKIFVALSGHTAKKPNQSAAVVYDVENAKGTIKSVPNLSFFINSKAYPEKCEIEGCDISPSDGKLYFSTNRIKNGNGRDYDGVHVFKNYTYNESIFPQTTIGNVDAISGGQGTVTVRGWAFDRNATSTSTPVHVYIGGPAGSGEGHAITANTYRNDVNSAFGCGNYHGFDATISTSLRGSQPVYIYAINTRKGTNVMIGSGWVNITSDTSAPGIGNVRVTEVSQNGYRVTCDVWDDTGVTSVRFPTWTTNNGQDDLVWHEGSVSGNTATCYISRNDHNGEYGTYYTHIYAYDPYGNQSCNGDTSVYLEQPLSIYNYGIVDLGSVFYAKIVNVNANKDVAVDCTNTNGNVIIYDKSEAGDHIWKFERNDDGSYKITNMYNGKCLDLAYGANSDGANVGIWDYNGGSNQKWYIYNVNGRYALKAACSDRVIDVYGGSTDNMSNVQTWTFNGGNNQLFGIDIIDYKGTLADLGTSFNAKIGNVNADKDVSADLSNANGNVIIYDKSNVADHIWRFDRYADGSYKITNTYNGKCLDVYAASAESGANVALWEDNGGANQKWYIYSYDGNYVLKSACTDCYLDVYGSGTDNFTNVHMWEFNGGRNQQFTIDKV